jgi:hypothetical protein
MAPRRGNVFQALLGGLLAFVFVRALLVLARAFLGAPRSEPGGETGAAKPSTKPRRARAPRIDRASAIDVPFTVLADGVTGDHAPAEPRPSSPSARGSG